MKNAKEISDSANRRSIPIRPSLANEVHGDMTGMRVGAVLPQINPLPCPQSHASGMNRDGKIHCRQRGADVGRHVILTLRGVYEDGITIPHEPGEEGFQVAADIGIGIFLDQQ